MPTRAGKLNCALTIQSPPERDGFTDDPANARWQTVGTLFARPIAKSGLEKFVQPEYLAAVSYAFSARYNPNVTPQNRLVFKGKPLNIQFAFDPDQRGRDMLIGCTEIVKT
jgi:head-tail adaptor